MWWAKESLKLYLQYFHHNFIELIPKPKWPYVKIIFIHSHFLKQTELITTQGFEARGTPISARLVIMMSLKSDVKS